MLKKVVVFLLVILIINSIMPMYLVKAKARDLNDRERSNVESAIQLLRDTGQNVWADRVQKKLDENKIKSDPDMKCDREAETSSDGTITIKSSNLDPMVGRRSGQTLDQILADPSMKLFWAIAFGELADLAGILVHEQEHAWVFENMAWSRYWARFNPGALRNFERAAYSRQLTFLQGVQRYVRKTETDPKRKEEKLIQLENLKSTYRTNVQILYSSIFNDYNEKLARAPDPINLGTNLVNVYIFNPSLSPDLFDFGVLTSYDPSVILIGLQAENGYIVDFSEGGFYDPNKTLSVSVAVLDRILSSSDPIAEAQTAYDLGEYVLKNVTEKWDLVKNEWDNITYTITPDGGVVEIVNDMLHIISPAVVPSFTAASANDPSIITLSNTYTVEFRDNVTFPGEVIHIFNDNLHSNITMGYNSTHLFTIDPTTEQIFDFANLTTSINRFYNFTLLIDSEVQNINIYRDGVFIKNLKFEAIDANASSGWVWTAAQKGAELYEDFIYIGSGLYPPNNPPAANPDGPYFGNEREPVSFTSNSFDTDGAITDYRWSFGDGTISSDQNPTHTYDLPPRITIISPEPKTYYTDQIDLIFYNNPTLPVILEVFDNNNKWHLEATNITLTKDPLSWIGYSLDEQQNVTISGNTTLIDLSPGPHILTIYTEDDTGKTGFAFVIFEISKLVGGIVIPIDKLALLAPFIALAVIVVAVTLGTVCAKKRWFRKAVVQRH